jgi:tRNA A-37 threonylcarbamoyl transferase component Bud32/tetratricopeptide (TPR) repeat protein
MLASGTTVGRYVVLDQLGEGAMGEVYRAWDNALDRVVALKILLPLRADSPAARKRFAREARLTARINHPCVAHIYDVGEIDDCPFIAMEFVPGRQLRDEMHEPVPPGRVTFLARQILEGLAEAHRQGVVHRDLKPENILISGRDQVKLLDFGLAKRISEDVSEATDLSTTGLTGTPRYMAPEQVQGHDVDARTDIYALGTVLYELLTAHPAHNGSTLAEMLMSVVHKPAADLTDDICPAPLSRAIKRALKKKPADRFPTAQAMLEALSLVESADDGPPLDRGMEHVPHPRAEVYTRRAREALTGIGNSSSVAAEMLERAIELDPDYPLAYAIHAEACAAACFTGQVNAKWFDKAQASLDRAEALDPNLPDLRVARARIVWAKHFNFPAETALRELRLALRRAPSHVGALRLWATITSHVGLFDHADAALARLRANDPKDQLVLVMSGSLNIVRGRPKATVEELNEALRLDPKHEDVTYWWLYCHAKILMGHLDEAEDAVRATLRRQSHDPLTLALAALIRAVRRDPRETHRLARSVEQTIKAELHPHHAYHLLACAESLLGETDAALAWLKRCGDEGMPCWPWFSSDPLLSNLRADPEGAAYLSGLRRRFEYFQREFPQADRPQDLSYVATEVPDA